MLIAEKHSRADGQGPFDLHVGYYEKYILSLLETLPIKHRELTSKVSGGSKVKMVQRLGSRQFYYGVICNQPPVLS